MNGSSFFKCFTAEDIFMGRLSKSPKCWLHDPQGGFTLIEVMMALAILTIGILSIVGLQYHIINGTTNANVVSQQLHLAQRIMERAKNISDLKDLNDINLVGVDHEGNPGGPYTVVATPTAVPGDDVEKARFITVTVTRNGGIGGHPVTLRCLTQGNGV